MYGTGAMLGIVISNVALIGLGYGDALLSIGIIGGSVIQWAIPPIVNSSLNSEGGE